MSIEKLGALRAQLLQAVDDLWDETDDSWSPKLILSLEALGKRDFLYDEKFYSPVFVVSNGSAGEQALDAMLIQPAPLRYGDVSALSDLANRPEWDLPELQELAAQLPYITHRKISIADFPGYEFLCDHSHRLSIYEFALLLLHRSVLEDIGGHMWPVILGHIIDNVPLKDIDTVYECSLVYSILSEVYAPERDARETVIRRKPYKGFRDLLSFQHTQRLGTAGKVTVHKDIKVSILVPTFNSIKTLDETLSSLVRQYHTNWEAIIVDGTSTDGTWELVEKWNSYDARIRYIKQESSGLAAARNEGIKESTGEYLHCLDGDDYVEPNFYALMLMPVYAAGDKVISLSSLSKFIKQHDILFDWEAPRKDDLTLEAFASGTNLPCNTVMFKKELLERTADFDPDLTCCEDWDLWIRFARVGVEFKNIDKAHAWCRMHEGGLSRKYLYNVETFLDVSKRMLHKDERCRGVTVQIDNPRTAHEDAVITFWLDNVRRACSQGEFEVMASLSHWARTELSQVLKKEAYADKDYSFYTVDDVPSEELSASRELECRLEYLKVFTDHLQGEMHMNILKDQISSTLYYSKVFISELSDAGYAKLKASCLQSAVKGKLSRICMLKVKWELFKLKRRKA